MNFVVNTFRNSNKLAFPMMWDPTNPLMWDLEYFTWAVANGKICQHACLRIWFHQEKLTPFPCSHCESFVCELPLYCDGQHVQQPWDIAEDGSFGTDQEAEYPEPYVSSMLKFSFMNYVNNGISSQVHILPRRSRSFLLPTTKGAQTAAADPEYSCTKAIQVENLPPVDHKGCLTKSLQDIPAGNELFTD